MMSSFYIPSPLDPGLAGFKRSPKEPSPPQLSKLPEPMKRPIVLLCVAAIAPIIIFAADPPATREPGEDAMMKALTRQLLGQFDAIQEVISTPEYAAKTAKMYAVHRDALLKEGFSREEAMSLLLSDGYFMKVQGEK
jgi:hypothetical protein